MATVSLSLSSLALSLSLSASITPLYSLSRASPWEVGFLIFYSHLLADLVCVFSDCFFISGFGKREGSRPTQKKEYGQSSFSPVAPWLSPLLSFSRHFPVSLSGSIHELCYHCPRNQKILKMIIAEGVTIPETVTFRSSITPL